jgi:hypothetical protein
MMAWRIPASVVKTAPKLRPLTDNKPANPNIAARMA